MRLIDADALIETIECSADLGGALGDVVTSVKQYAIQMVDSTATYHPVADWVHDILRRYEEAVRNDRIYKPVAYTLYQAWKYYDDHEKARRSKDHDDRDW